MATVNNKDWHQLVDPETGEIVKINPQMSHYIETLLNKGEEVLASELKQAVIPIDIAKLMREVRELAKIWRGGGK